MLPVTVANEANLGDFLKNLTEKRVGVRPPLDPRLNVSDQWK